MSQRTSTVDYLSNLQPMKNDFDTKFMTFIHDPFILEEMKKLISDNYIRYQLTDIQKEEMKSASGHCLYAFKDDYPWGSVENNGRKRVICKCINRSCSHFNECRNQNSPFNELELNNNKVVIDNGNERTNKIRLQGKAFKDSLKKSDSIEFNDKKVEKDVDLIKSLDNNNEKIKIVNKGSEVHICEYECDTNTKLKDAFIAIKERKKKKIIESPSEEKIIIESPSEEKIIIEDVCPNDFSKFIQTKQKTVIEANYSERIIVNAGPGTGKTWALIERLIYMVNECDIEPDEIMVLCFSRAAIEVIKKRLELAFRDEKVGVNWNAIDIRTFDSFGTWLLYWAKENEPEFLPNKIAIEKLDYDSRIFQTIELLKKDKKIIEQCKHLVVDEVQDLVEYRAKLIQEIIGCLPKTSGYTLLGDSCQAIYDYQAKDTDIDSVKFYAWMFKTQKKSKYCKFIKNYRQISGLEKNCNEYRKSLLHCNKRELKNASNNIYGKIEQVKDLNLKNPDKNQLIDLCGNGKLGILTRTNGQALKISMWLTNADIEHKLQKSAVDRSLNRWIADIFCEYEKETISEVQFISLFCMKVENNKEKAKKLWDIIEKEQNKVESRYYVKDLLSSILTNIKANEFYTGVFDSKITVSNIHRSKGREYDKIILLEDLLLVEDEDDKNIQEHKVSYVALTRAKEHIYRTSIGKQYIRVYKYKNRSRAYQVRPTYKKGKEKFVCVEIGKEYDINPISFLDNAELKNILKTNEIIGERVVLIKNIEKSESKGYICYDIRLEDDGQLGILGTTSELFYKDLDKILNKVYVKCSGVKVFKEVFPERLCDIYIDDIITVIDKGSKSIKDAKLFSDIMIWKGITIAGFAKNDNTIY